MRAGIFKSEELIGLARDQDRPRLGLAALLRPHQDKTPRPTIVDLKCPAYRKKLIHRSIPFGQKWTCTRRRAGSRCAIAPVLSECRKTRASDPAGPVLGCREGAVGRWMPRLSDVGHSDIRTCTISGWMLCATIPEAIGLPLILKSRHRNMR